MTGQGSLIRLQLEIQLCIKVYFIHLLHALEVEFVIQFFLSLFVSRKGNIATNASGYNGKLINRGTGR